MNTGMNTGLLVRSPAGARRRLVAKSKSLPAHAARRPGEAASHSALTRLAMAALCLTLMMIASMMGSAVGDAQPNSNDYRLDAMDKVRLKVFEWRPSRDEIYEWKALNDDYVIGAGGRVSLPMIGEVAAAGLTPNELARAIGQRMQTQIGLVEMPNISVEVMKFRPFYITGRVATPGEYDYRPNLTVLQALSLAGGYYRADRQTGARLEREAISGQGDLELLSLDRSALIARRARIEADLNDLSEIVFPVGFEDASESNRMLVSEERSILKARRDAISAQINPMAQLKRHLETEISSISKQLDVHRAQSGLANEELNIVKSLQAKKLAVETRRIQAQRNVYQLDSDQMTLQMNLVRVRQEVTKADLSISELKSKRANDLTEELRATQAKLDEVARKYATTRKLLFDTAMTDGEPIGDESKSVSPTYSFKIVRTDGGQTTQITADETTPVQPGDTIKVEPNLAAAPIARRLPPSDEDGAYAPTKKPSPPADSYKFTPTRNSSAATGRFI